MDSSFQRPYSNLSNANYLRAPCVNSSSVLGSGCPSKYCPSTRENTESGSEALAKRVMLDRNFRSSGKPKMSEAVFCLNGNRALAHSISRWPSTG